MSSFNIGEVWLARFPLEEKPNEEIERPVVVLAEDTIGILSVKVTSHSARDYDPYDTPIYYWSEAGLRLASTARVSKTMILNKSKFRFKIGSLHEDDLKNIEEQYIKMIESRK